MSLSPISLLAGVLGRVARALAARARFSLDRFSDVYLVTDAIAAHAGRAAKGARMSFAISTDAQRLELTIGPFLDGSGSQLSHQAPDYSAASALTMLSDELDIRNDDSGEVLHVVMVDRRRSLAAAAGAGHSPVSNSSGVSTSVSRSATPVRLSRRCTCWGPLTIASCRPCSSAR